jgi:tyrosyl-tRNA synthetase
MTINRIMESKHPREIQHRLAFEVTKFIHGQEAARQAQEGSEKLFDSQEPAAEAEKVPTVTISKTDLPKKLTIVEILGRSNLAPSKSAARRLIEQGGVKLNNQKIADPKAQISKKDFNTADTATLSVGKRKIVKLVLK